MIEVTGVVTRAHNIALSRIARDRVLPLMSFGKRYAGVLLFVGAIFAFGAAQELASDDPAGGLKFPVWMWTLAGLLAGFVSAIVGINIYGAGYFAAYLRDDGIGLGLRTFTLTDDELIVRGPLSETRTKWEGLLAVSAHKTLVAIWTDPGAAFVIPRDAIGEDIAVGNLLEFVEARLPKDATGKNGS